MKYEYISEGDIKRNRMVSIHTDFQNLSKKNMDRKTAGKNLTILSSFLGKFTKLRKLRKATISFVMSVCLTVLIVLRRDLTLKVQSIKC